MLAQEMINRLKQARQRHLTIAALAEKTRVDRSSLNAYLNGRKNVEDMTVATFSKLAGELGYDLSGRPPPPDELGELINAWDHLPPETQAHLLFIIDSVLSTQR